MIWCTGSTLKITVVKNGSQLAKMEKSIPHMHAPAIYRVEVVGLKNSNYT